MEVYLDLVMLLNFAVDFLLLLGTAGLSGVPPRMGRTILAAALGGAYGGVCLLGGFRFLGNPLWRMVVLGLMGWISFGISMGGLRRTLLFALLSMALGGVALGLGDGSFGTLVGSAVLVALMCIVGFRGKAEPRELVEVCLLYLGERSSFYALRDTGNTLRDPVTGESVLVVGAQIARRLLGLTKEQLENPVETMASSVLDGLRLIPYRSVGQSQGMLLAMRIPEVRIGRKSGPALVAFAPSGLDPDGTYQALIGGSV